MNNIKFKRDNSRQLGLWRQRKANAIDSCYFYEKSLLINKLNFMERMFYEFIYYVTVQYNFLKSSSLR